jgi:hypothetical protein
MQFERETVMWVRVGKKVAKNYTYDTTLYYTGENLVDKAVVNFVEGSGELV